MMEITSSFQLGARPDERQRLSEAATRFEAIFARQMLASARQAGFGDDLFGGQGSDTFRQMMDERFADILADSGALGFGKTIEAQLAARLDVTSQDTAGQNTAVQNTGTKG